MKLKVLNSQGQETGREVEMSAAVFGAEPNDHAIYLDVKQYLANQRQGTHKSKDKGEVTASTKKIKRQKGTGTARAGSVKSGVMKGGGRFHGPRPRDYSFKLNKKLKVVARISALSYKAQENNIIVIESLKMDAPNTKGYVDFLNNLNVAGNRSLLVTGDYDSNVHLSSRNITNAEVSHAEDISTYQVLKAKQLIITEDSLGKIQETLSK
jgi:large subunit ribosomal protein L4